MSLESIWLVCLLFFTISTLYSSVGFGGGSSYIALLSLSSLSIIEIRSTALLANILVVTINLIVFSRNFKIPWKAAFQISALSIPLAFFGGLIHLTNKIFFMLLGSILILAALSMFVQSTKNSRRPLIKKPNNFLVSGFIGFISGLVSIGGGIFLSPYLYLSDWNKPKQIAATSSLFILVNSIAAFTGLAIRNSIELDPHLIWLLLSVTAGSFLGKKITLSQAGPLVLRGLTALLVFIVGIKIFLTL